MRKWLNSFSEVEELGQGKFGMTIHVGHQVFNDNGQWKKHKLTETPDYILMQSAKCCVEVHPYYAVYYDVNHEIIRVEDSRWVVQRWTGKKWRDLGFWNPVLNIEDIPNGIKVTREGLTTDGVLKIEFIQFDANLLKHKITWTNTTNKVMTIRIVMKWSGIVANKITNVRKNSYTPPVTISDGLFLFKNEHGLVLIGEVLLEQFREGILNPVEFTMQANGMKADFEFEEFVVAPNDSVVIDPLTYTNNNPSEDGHIRNISEVYTRWDEEQYILFQKIVHSGKGGYTLIDRGYVEWDIDAIPDNATLTLFKFKYYGGLNGDDWASIFSIESKPMTQSDDALWSDIANGTEYLVESTIFPQFASKEVGGAQCPWDISPLSDLQTALTAQSWFALGFKSEEKRGQDGNNFASEDAPISPSAFPTLYVEYTLPLSVGYSYQDGLVCVMVAG